MATLSRRLVAGALSGALLMSAVFFTNAAPCAFAEQEKQPRVLADEPFPQIPVGAPRTGRQYSPHRSYLRPGCTWDVFGRGLQQCNVYSHAMLTPGVNCSIVSQQIRSMMFAVSE